MDERVFPVLGVLKVAAACEAAGHDVDMLDLSGISDVATAVGQHITLCGPSDAYGLTATMPQMPATATIARLLRQLAPGARLLLGGPHATLLNASWRHERKAGRPGRSAAMMDDLFALFDTVVCGDGELTVGLALHPDAPPLIDVDDANSPLFLRGDTLEQAPLPARHLLDLSSYRYAIEGVATMSLIAQLGCPFGCAFCGGRRSPFLRRVRMRSTESVLGEIRHLHEAHGCRGFMFLDDELNVNTQFMPLLDGIIGMQRELGVEFRLRGLLKSELLTAPMAERMAQAGFRQVLVGFESGSPRILQNIQKRATVEDNTRCVRLLRDAGIKVKALMSIGHAGEDEGTVAATVDWLTHVDPDDFDITIITVYPGTPYYDDAVETSPGVWTYTAKNGDRLHARQVDHLRDVNFYKGMPGAYQSFVWTDTLTSERLCALRDAAEDHVRTELSIAWPKAAAERDYEHSMGMR